MKLKKKSSGFTLIEIVVATGAVMVGLSGTLAFLKLSQKEKKRAEMVTGAGDLHPPILQSMNTLLFSATHPTTKKNTEGLCKLFKPGEIRSDSPLTEINLDLTPANVTAALNPLWTGAFQGAWEFVTTGCPLSGPWGRCLKPNYQSYPADVRTKVMAMDPLIKAKITPLVFDPVESQLPLFSPFPAATTLVDAKKVLFQLNSEIEFSSSGEGKGQRKVDSQSKYVWAAELGWCDTVAPGTTRAIRLFPTATGEGDSTGINIYNSTSFVKGGNFPPLDIIPQKKQIQKGVIDGGQVRSDPAQNIEVSCNEVQFKCRNDSSTQRTYSPTFFMDYGITFNPNNSTQKVPSSAISCQLTVRQASDQATSENADDIDLLAAKGARVDYDLDSIKRYYEWPNSRFYDVQPPANNTAQAPTGTNPTPLQMAVRGYHQLRMSVSNAQTACREICSVDNFQNLPYRPRLKYTLWDVKKADGKPYQAEYLATNPVGCTACYMKNCTRFGIGTFGPMKEQPDEPLDASVPECAIKNSAHLSQYLPVSATVENNISASSCVAARLDTIGGTLTFVSRDCNEGLPALCFNYGKFFLAKNVSASSSQIANVNYSQAAQRCYETSKETVNKTELQKMFEQQLSPTTLISALPTVFFNNASQGVFLAPQSIEQIRSAANSVKSDGLANGQHFWVGYRTDSNSNLMAVPPIASIRNETAYQFSLFFENNGRATLKQHVTAPAALVSAPASGSVGGYVLAHHVRYRGLIAANPTQPTTAPALEFLCWKNQFPYFFATQGKASRSQADGDQRCKQSGGSFIPPITPLGWVQALTAVSAISTSYAFPDPNLTTVPALWVGLKTNNELVDPVSFQTRPKDDASKVMCQLSTGIFEDRNLRLGEDELGCPDGSKRVRFSGAPGLVNQIIWLMAFDDKPITGSFYVGDE